MIRRLLLALLLCVAPGLALRAPAPVAAAAVWPSVGRYANCTEVRAAAHGFPQGSILYIAIYRYGNRSGEAWWWTPTEVYAPVARCGYVWRVAVIGPNGPLLYDEWGAA